MPALKRYALIMTLSQRNNCIKGGILVSFICLCTILLLIQRLLPLYPSLTAAAVQRPPGLIPALGARFFSPVPQAPLAAMTAMVLCALIVPVLIYFFFEKTQSAEITFFTLFVLSFVFETLRLLVPLRALYDFPMFLPVLGTRILLSGRFFGALSFFASSVYAAGLNLQKQGNIIFGIVIITLIIFLGLPVDGMAWDTSLTMISGYSFEFRMAEAGILFLAVISFLAGVYIRGTREYLYIALGALLVSLGRSFLIGADSWALSLSGLIILAAGTWFITTRLHQVYMWL
ncbi:MAG: hypothetical protein LBQ44_02870 [Treponema sp.]|jgi:hypothetical protein|nr:hypothetical protein [Treponema sp.]